MSGGEDSISVTIRSYVNLQLQNCLGENDARKMWLEMYRIIYQI